MATYEANDGYVKQGQCIECFDDPEVRMGFIRKVYGILSAQLTLTVFFCLAFMYIPAMEVLINPAMMITAITFYIVSACMLVCCCMDRKVPLNYILLAIFTLCTSYLVAFICMQYNRVTVLEAAALTAAVTFGLTIYAFKTKTDFTLCGPLLYTLGMLFLFGGIFMILFGPSMNLLWSIFGVFLYSFYLIYDTQMIIGGKRHSRLEADSYILGALLLYLDIINLFLEILKLLGDR